MKLMIFKMDTQFLTNYLEPLNIELNNTYFIITAT